MCHRDLMMSAEGDVYRVTARHIRSRFAAVRCRRSGTSSTLVHNSRQNSSKDDDGAMEDDGLEQ